MQNLSSKDWRQFLWKSILLLFALGIVGWVLITFTADARGPARKTQCQNNLRMIYKALERYVALHGDVPRGKEGQASLDPFEDPQLREGLGIESSVLRCPADKDQGGTSYVLNPGLTPGDLGSKSKTIVACERHPHQLRGSRNPVTVLLVGYEGTVNMDLPQKDQDEWRRLFLAGDKRACTLSFKEGVEYGSISDILWYLGPEKGYVPNEQSW